VRRWIPRRKRLTKRGRKWPVTRELDTLLRRIVMARDHETCRRCGRKSAPGRGQAIETAHIIPKGSHPSMRYRLDNVLALCHSCHHFFAHKDPVGFVDWLGTVLAPGQLDRLRLVSAQGGRVDREADRLWLESEAARYGVIITLDREQVRPYLHDRAKKKSTQARRKKT
jgi:predicted restriction endonuclease